MARPRRTSVASSDAFVQDFVAQATNAAFQAEDLKGFLGGLREGAGYLRDKLTSASAEKSRDLLNAAFESLGADPRRRRILELCAWPVFDKASLPQEAAAPGDFLWLFALPFVVQLSARQLDKPLLLEQNTVDGEALLEIVETSGVMAVRDGFRCFSTLLRREDLHAYGPQNIAQAFVEGELSGEAGLQPLPVFMDEDIESCRAFTVFVPCAMRMPVGLDKLFQSRQGWLASRAAKVVREGFERAGVAVDLVVSLPPVSFTESLFRCAGVGTVELEVNLIEARRLYGELAVTLRHPAQGYAEITALNEAGEEILVVPPFPFFEPKKALAKAVRDICVAQGLEFRGSYSLQTPAPTLLQ